MIIRVYWGLSNFETLTEFFLFYGQQWTQQCQSYAVCNDWITNKYKNISDSRIWKIFFRYF
jgi:hypothetical protein